MYYFLSYFEFGEICKSGPLGLRAWSILKVYNQTFLWEVGK